MHGLWAPCAGWLLFLALECIVSWLQNCPQPGELWLLVSVIPLPLVPVPNPLPHCTLRAPSSLPLVWLLPAFLPVRLFLPENLPLWLSVILEQHFEIVSRGFASRGRGILRLAVKQTCHIDFLLCQKLKKQEWCLPKNKNKQQQQQQQPRTMWVQEILQPSCRTAQKDNWCENNDPAKSLDNTVEVKWFFKNSSQYVAII